MKLSDYKLRGWKYANILKRIVIKDKLIVLLKVSIEELGFKGYLKNLVAVDREENIIWIARIPQGYSHSFTFDDIKFEEEKLKAWRGDLYCEIDIDTGRILYKQETR